MRAMAEVVLGPHLLWWCRAAARRGRCLLDAVLPAEFNPHWSHQTLSKKHQEWLTCLFPGMLLVCGGLVNGPYSLITTAVSADLVSWFTSDSSPWIHPGLLTQSEHSCLFWPQGTHKSLKGNARALSTVTAIIDGTGSVGQSHRSQVFNHN